jgi:putative inorganic carbon (HCO3(-)) transporter
MSMPASQRRPLPIPLAFAAAACLAGLMIALLPQSQLVLVAAIVLVLVMLAVILAEPVVGLAIALIVGPFQPLERVTLQLPLDSGQIALAVTLLAYGFRWLASRSGSLSWSSAADPQSSPRRPLAVIYALMAFVAVCLLSFFPARDFRDWATECIKWLQIGIVALLIAGESDPAKRGIIVGAILVSAAGQAAFGLIQADVRGFGPAEFRIRGTDAYRAYGTFEQPNPFGGFMGLTWPVAAAVAAWSWWRVWPSLHALILSLRPESKGRDAIRPAPMLALALATTLVTVLCLAALNASGSRGALVGATAAMLVVVLSSFRRVWPWAGAALVLALALLAFDVVNIPPSLEAQLQWFDNAGVTFGVDVRNAHVTPITFSTIERLAHWQAAIRMAESSPWLGVGFGNYAAVYPAFRLLPWENALGHAHNYYLNLLAEVGVIGCLLYLVLWTTIIVVTWQAARRSGLRALPSALCVGILGAWAHLTAHHLFDKLYVANMHLYIGTYLGLVLAARPDGERERGEQR